MIKTMQEFKDFISDIRDDDDSLCEMAPNAGGS